MMEKIKNRWEISSNWQLLFPILGLLMCVFTAHLIARKLLNVLAINDSYYKWTLTILITVLGSLIILKICFWCFRRLENKWIVNEKWEMIAIFIVFAITGSLSAKIAEPLTHWIGIERESSSAWLYWPVRILIILPIYQLLLVIIGWLFGQFTFFWNFEKKMLRRLGFGFLIR